MYRQKRPINWLKIALTPQFKRAWNARLEPTGEPSTDHKVLTLWIHAVLMRGEIARDAFAQARTEIERSTICRQQVKKQMKQVTRAYDKFAREFDLTLRGEYSKNKDNVTLEQSCDVLDGILESYLKKIQPHIDILYYAFDNFFMQKGAAQHALLARISLTGVLMKIARGIYEAEVTVDIIKPMRNGLKDFSCSALAIQWEKLEEEVLRAVKFPEGEVFDKRVNDATKALRLAMESYDNIGEAYNEFYGKGKEQ